MIKNSCKLQERLMYYYCYLYEEINRMHYLLECANYILRFLCGQQLTVQYFPRGAEGGPYILRILARG